MKKMFSLALALIMALALCVPAMAANSEGQTGTITVNNPMAGETYTAYKIFDVTYDGTNYAYTIKAGSEWYDEVAAYADLTLTAAAVAGATDADKVYVVTPKDTFSAPAFAEYLNRQLDAAPTSYTSGKELTVDEGVASVTGLDLGYYFVASTNGALCNLTTTDPSVEIYDKNEIIFEKDADDESVEVGQTVTFTINAELPENEGFTSYIYTVKDKMSSGLTFNKDVKMYIYDTIEINFAEGSVDYDSIDNGFELTLDLCKNFVNYTPGTPIKFVYTATVNDAAVNVVSVNEATLTYSNDPTDSTKTTTTPPSKEYLYSAEIVIDKVDGKTNEKLDGAQFVLYKLASDNSKEYYKYTAATATTPADVSWVKLTDDAVAAAIESDTITDVITDTNGAAEFDGLQNGTYYLLETKAPTGYNMLKDAVEVEIEADLSDENPTEEEIITIDLRLETQVKNNSGIELPSTGGIGTTIFYTVGGVLMAAAVVLFVTKKKLSVQE